MVPSRTQVASLHANRHQRGKEKMKCLPRAQALTGGVAFTNGGSTSCRCDPIVCEARRSHSELRIGAAALWSGVLETRRFKGRCTTEAAVPRGVAKRFELSTGLRETFPKLTTVTRDEAANMFAAGKLRNEADGWKSQPATDHHTGCWDVHLWQEITMVYSLCLLFNFSLVANATSIAQCPKSR